MKILRITTITHSLHLLLRGQLKFLKQNGYKVYVASNTSDEVKFIESNEGVKHFSIPFTRKFNPFYDLLSLYYTIRLINYLKPDIVHTHSPKAGIVGMLAAFICNVPVKLHTVAGLPLMETKGLKMKILIYIEKLTYKLADYVLPNSYNLLSYIQKNIYSKSNNKLKVIGHGSSNGINLNYFNQESFDTAYIKEKKKELGIRNTDVVISFVGRLVSYKGINELIESFLDLNIIYTNLKLVLVGPLEPLNPLKIENLKILDQNKNIISVGHQDDIRPYLIMSQIFAFPSYREGFPQSLMQAAAMNLCCIATDINGCNEIIEDEKTGFLIKPKDKNALYEKLHYLIKNESLIKKIGGNARKNMELKFEQEEFWDSIHEFYQKCLDEKNNN